MQPMSFAKSSIAERLVGDFGVLAVIGLWWLWSRSIPEYVLPGPGAVGYRMAGLLIDPEFLEMRSLASLASCCRSR